MNIPFSPPDISEAEIEEVIAALKSGWITTGPKTKEFEKRITDYSKLDGIKVLTKYGFNFNKVDYQCKTLIVNTLDLEPFFGNNYFILANHPKEILTATSSIGRFLNFDEIYLIMDNKNIDLISKYNDLISNYSPIQIKQVDNFYPEANNEMIKELLHLHQAAILNTREVYKAYHILKKNIPKNELLITITGEAVRNPNVVLVKKYSLLSEAFLQNNDFTSRMVDVYLNGFLSGEKINTLRYVIDENINGIIINKKEEKDIKKCSDCGLCAKYCPRKINPKVVMEKGGNVEAYIKERCIDCGICNFICPANSHSSI